MNTSATYIPPLPYATLTPIQWNAVDHVGVVERGVDERAVDDATLDPADVRRACASRR
jgi:hypothetical protein